MKQILSTSSFRRVISIIVTVIIMVAMLTSVAHLVERKASSIRFTPFFEEKNDFDVILLGSSHMRNGISPMYLWRNYGIASYNFGGSGYRIPTSYWTMMNVLDYTNPKLIILDCCGLESEKKIPNDHENLHEIMDSFKFSRAKNDAITDLLGDDAMFRMEMIWKYSIYHARWHDITKEDFVYEYTKDKGANEDSTVAIPAEMTEIEDDDIFQGENYGTEYLRKFIKECKDREIELLLVFIPFPATVTEQQGANRVRDIANEFGVPYVNMLKMNIVDYKTDCQDSASHLNYSGVTKVSDFIGKYLSEHYDLEDHRMDPSFAAWHNEYFEYRHKMHDMLLSEDTLGDYMMLASDKEYDKEIQVNNKKLYDSEVYIHLLANMGVEEEAILERPHCIVINGEGCKYNEDVYDMTAIAGVDADVQIMVIDRGTSEIVDTAAFTFDTAEDVPYDYLVTTGVYR